MEQKIEVPNNNKTKIQYFQITSSFHIDFNKLSINSHNQLWKQILIIDGKPTINFHNQKSLIKLTSAIIKQIFNLQWNIQQNHLCPRIPNRINYLMWIHKYIQPLLQKNNHQQKLLKQIQQIQGLNQHKQSHKKQHKHKQQQQQYKQLHKQIKCIDIGTGSSLIYPLLGYKIFGWKFIATQISSQSLLNCKNLIEINKLNQHIKLIQSNNQHILKNTITLNQSIDFLLCNPPFFDTQSDYLQPLSKMQSNQHNTIGGQYQFFFNIYLESFYYTNIQYFTLMIGLKRDFVQIKRFLLQEYQQYQLLESVKFGQLNQGNNVRFVVCWRVKRQQKKLNYRNSNKNR